MLGEDVTSNYNFSLDSLDALLNNAWLLVELGKMEPAEAAAAFKKSFISGCQ